MRPPVHFPLADPLGPQIVSVVAVDGGMFLFLEYDQQITGVATPAAGTIVFTTGTQEYENDGTAWFVISPFVLRTTTTLIGVSGAPALCSYANDPVTIEATADGKPAEPFTDEPVILS